MLRPLAAAASVQLAGARLYFFFSPGLKNLPSASVAHLRTLGARQPSSLRYATLAEGRFFKPGEKKNDAARAMWEQLDEEPVPGQDSVAIGTVNCIE